MADVTGALHHEFGGKSYCLRLTLGGIANLQRKYGNDVGGLFTPEGIPGIPPFGLLIDVLAEALKKGEGVDYAEAHDLADDMLSADSAIVQQVLAAAFPDAGGGSAGNGKAPKQKRER